MLWVVEWIADGNINGFNYTGNKYFVFSAAKSLIVKEIKTHCYGGGLDTWNGNVTIAP